MPQIEKPDDLQSFGFFICMTITFNDGNKSVFIFMYQSAKKMLVVSPHGFGMLIWQALHLAKSLPFTDKSLENAGLSVKCVLLTDRSAKNGTLSVITSWHTD